MLNTETIDQIPTDRDDVFAFRIKGRVTAEDFEKMGEMMNRAFDAFDKVNMLLVFDGFAGRETGASWQPEALKSQVRSLGKVGKYVVVGAPESGERMIEAMDEVIPVDAEAFPREREAEAWAAVGARPAA